MNTTNEPCPYCEVEPGEQHSRDCILPAEQDTEAEEEEGKPLADFIAANRTALYAAIWKQYPDIPLDDDDVAQWIANDEGLYEWARNEGVSI